MIKVSVITVCYNSEKTIQKTIESVLHQTYQNVEYIIIDGKSTDATLEIVKEYEPLFHGRLRWISEPDTGIYDAMNKGIKMSTGDLVGIVNSDDFYEKNAVEIMVNNMTNDRFQLLYGAVRHTKNGLEKSIVFENADFLHERNIEHPGCFVTKATYEELGAYDTSYKYLADYDFIIRVWKSKTACFIPVYSVISNFEEGGASSLDECFLENIRVWKQNGLMTDKEYQKKMIMWKFRNMVVKIGLWR